MSLYLLMKKVLIVAGELKTGEHFQQVLSQSGYQTALVWNSVQLVDFCGQNDPDFTVIDLDLGGPLMWNALQGIKGMGALANMPVVGISTSADSTSLNDAKNAGLLAVFPKEDGPESLAAALGHLSDHSEGLEQMDSGTEPVPPALSDPEPDAAIDFSDRVQFGGSPEFSENETSLSRLKLIVKEIQSTTTGLENKVEEFGEDGPELFGYIMGSGGEIANKLREIGETSLYDQELRHDFRNMIGSVTGFSELILMEPGLSDFAQKGLTRLRECSKDFVELLDEQKALAEA